MLAPPMPARIVLTQDTKLACWRTVQEHSHFHIKVLKQSCRQFWLQLLWCIGITWHAGLAASHNLLWPAGVQGLSIVVAAGPFSSKDNALYEPLQALLEQCKEQLPDVLVLLGPFVDAEHPLVQAGMLEDSFQDVFAAQVLLLKIARCCYFAHLPFNGMQM